MKKQLIFILLFSFSTCFSQNKKEDVFFIINFEHKQYTLGHQKLKSNINSLKMYSAFSLYDRKEYSKRQDEIKQESIGLGGGKRIPKALTFRLKDNVKEVITHCDMHKQSAEIVDYNWLMNNSWKENNSNIQFKDLYFLLKLEKDKYLKFKVERTVIAY